MSSNPARDLCRPSARIRYAFLPALILAAAALYWLFQVAWFWRFCGHNINADAISYIGIARHVVQGEVVQSLHGYWSPLISWLIAAVSFHSDDPTLPARLLMLPLFVLCLVCIYKFTVALWERPLLGALAVLWFVAARGMAAFSVCFIGADLLLTASVLLYFIVLFRCLRQPHAPRNWISLGGAHGLAFLAKAIAMPLLAFASVLAAGFVFGKTPKQAARTVVLAAIIPALVWMGWGTALRQKYHVFTTGYQLRWNLLDPAIKQARDPSSELVVLQDGRSTYDSEMVADAMPAGSRFWQSGVWSPTLLSRILHKERENFPLAVKELLVLLSPGGVLALILGTIQLTRHRREYPEHFWLLCIVALVIVALVVAYAMLVFDGRYVIPVAPLLMGFAIRFVLSPGLASERSDLDLPGRWQSAAGVLLVLGLLAVQIYWASPFRTINRDFQTSVHEAATVLNSGNAKTVVVIGKGPYPEHGVGWEAGVYTAYFARTRILATLFEVPARINSDAMKADIEKLTPDAVMVWGTPANPEYSAMIENLRAAYRHAALTRIRGSSGEVATVFTLKQKLAGIAGEQLTTQR